MTSADELPPRGITPEHFQLVELSRLFVEHVDDEVDVVDQDPSTTLEALDMLWPDLLFFQLVDDVFGDRLHLHIGPARSEQKIVRSTRYGGEV